MKPKFNDLNGLDEKYIINSVNSETRFDIEMCENLCSLNPECSGIFIEDFDRNYSTISTYASTYLSTSSTSSTTTDIDINREYMARCNTLRNTGGEMFMPEDFTSESYKKILSYSNASTSDIEVIILNIEVSQ